MATICSRVATLSDLQTRFTILDVYVACGAGAGWGTGSAGAPPEVGPGPGAPRMAGPPSYGIVSE
uniref:hypothetical protein n=1 Tax=Salmonella sp. SAL4457 TaxID=3159912 RepID=UPI00397C5987